MHHNVSDIEFLLTLCIAAVFVFACIAMQKPVINYYLCPPNELPPPRLLLPPLRLLPNELPPLRLLPNELPLLRLPPKELLLRRLPPNELLPEELPNELLPLLLPKELLRRLPPKVLFDDEEGRRPKEEPVLSLEEEPPVEVLGEKVLRGTLVTEPER